MVVELVKRRFEAFVMHFFLVAAACWLTAVSVNMSRGFKLRAGAPGGRGGGGAERRRFLQLCGAAWGLPAALTAAAATTFLLTAQPLQKRAFGTQTKHLQLAYVGPWYLPSFVETRTCFGDLAQTGDVTLLTTKKVGSLFFYYGPLSALLVLNVACLSRTAQRVHRLRTGNNMLQKAGDDSSRSVSQAQSVMVYIKLLLCTGLLETLLELASWASSNSSGDSKYLPHEWQNHGFTYRSIGYVCDLLRSLSVLWLAAPGLPARVAGLCGRLVSPAASARQPPGKLRSKTRACQRPTTSRKTN